VPAELYGGNTLVKFGPGAGAEAPEVDLVPSPPSTHPGSCGCRAAMYAPSSARSSRRPARLRSPPDRPHPVARPLLVLFGSRSLSWEAGAGQTREKTNRYMAFCRIM
jgi:hypothetical protein